MQDATYQSRNAILRNLGFADYGSYLASDLWRSIRLRVLRKRKRCQLCGKKARQVHHRNYTKEVLAGQSLAGLTPICGRCHTRIEFNKDGTKRPACAVERVIVEALANAYVPPKKKKPKKKHRLKPSRAEWADKHRQKPKQRIMGANGRPLLAPIRKLNGSVECQTCHCWRLTARPDGVCKRCRERAKTGVLT